MNPYIQNVQHKLAQLRDLVETQLVHSADMQKQYCDKNLSICQFHQGDKAWLTNPIAKKLDPRWEGGWVGKQIKGPVTAEIEKDFWCKIYMLNDYVIGHNLIRLNVSRKEIQMALLYPLEQ